MRKALLLFSWLLLLLSSNQLFAQEATPSTEYTVDELMELSLEELMNIKLSVTTGKASTLRDASSIISIITQDEIENSGARDLIDILRLVPGFEFVADVQSFTGLSMRGLPSSEGKISIFIDGFEMNEYLFGTVALGNHFSVDQIKQVEIIRGPGSANYGGTSELAVIKIITKGADLNGIQIASTYGTMGGEFGRSNTSIAFGKTLNQVKLYGSAFLGRAKRSTRNFYDFYSNTSAPESGEFYDMSDNSDIKTENIQAGVEYKGLQFKMMMDRYNIMQRDGYGEILPYAISNQMNMYALDLNYTYKINDKLSIKPQLLYSYQTPWVSEDTVFEWYSRQIQRYIGRTELQYNPNDKVNLIVGGQFYHDNGKVKMYDAKPELTYFFPNNASKVSYNNLSAYTQLEYITNFANFTAGARYDKHQVGFDAFVPRLGITKVMDKFHAKVLASQGFRTPTIQNFQRTDITAEKGTVLELELGYKFNNKLMIRANAFNIRIKDCIYYTSWFNEEGDLQYGYFNGEKTGSNGFETELRLQEKWGSINANYSYATVAEEHQLDAYAIKVESMADPNLQGLSPRTLLGMPGHKFTINGNFKVTKNLSFNASNVYLSERYSYTNTDENGNPLIRRFDPIYLLNASATFKNLFTEGLAVSISAFDLLDSKYSFIIPYNGYHAPLPGPTREFTLKLSYTVGL